MKIKFLFFSKVKEKIFFEHPHIEHLSETLLHVFVTIEMRGQSVDSEMKFNYRKSMHRVIQFICDIPVHRKAIRVTYFIPYLKHFLLNCKQFNSLYF